MVPFNKPLNPNWDFADELPRCPPGSCRWSPLTPRWGEAVAKMVEEVRASQSIACWARRLVQDDTGACDRCHLR